MATYDWESWLSVHPELAIRLEQEEGGTWRPMLRTEDRDGYAETTGLLAILPDYEREAGRRNAGAAANREE